MRLLKKNFEGRKLNVKRFENHIFNRLLALGKSENRRNFVSEASQDCKKQNLTVIEIRKPLTK